MRRGKWFLASAVGALAVVLGASIAMAASLDDGDYTLTLPGIGEFEFTVDEDGDESVTTVTPAPDGYAVDDDDPDKVAWKNAASLEVEAKTDKIEGDYDWSGGPATLTLPDGGTITISVPDAEGAFTVTTTGNWWAFGDGSDWYVANNSDINAATKFFRVEATSDGLEIKAVDGADDGFLNDLEEEEEEEEEEEIEEEEVEIEEEEEDDEGEGRGRSDA